MKKIMLLGFLFFGMMASHAAADSRPAYTYIVYRDSFTASGLAALRACVDGSGERSVVYQKRFIPIDAKRSWLEVTPNTKAERDCLSAAESMGKIAPVAATTISHTFDPATGKYYDKPEVTKFPAKIQSDLGKDFTVRVST